ncbi:hypothetical protein [Chitinophaga eiseniae]|uniref:Uncharacterized protein n=1 Tax=Chitinophaga eiseniae TaxID=634771 RepID=A0A847SU37_9BACT|nr:hypothetical protein [Chitinophaga eiseniae]NLR81139.1 hypothetical protein [Chitinophaga eiseniae]
MNKAIIKKFLVYFLLRDIPLLLVVFGLMGEVPLIDYIVNLFKSTLLAAGIFYILPLTILNGLLFAWPYVCFLKRFKGDGMHLINAGYWVGLLLLETILLKVSIYEDMSLLEMSGVFIYLVAFTWFFFRKELQTCFLGPYKCRHF